VPHHLSSRDPPPSSLAGLGSLNRFIAGEPIAPVAPPIIDKMALSQSSEEEDEDEEDADRNPGRLRLSTDDPDEGKSAQYGEQEEEDEEDDGEELGDEDLMVGVRSQPAADTRLI
jgi:hypothetical protein